MLFFKKKTETGDGTGRDVSMSSDVSDMKRFGIALSSLKRLGRGVSAVTRTGAQAVMDGVMWLAKTVILLSLLLAVLYGCVLFGVYYLPFVYARIAGSMGIVPESGYVDVLLWAMPCLFLTLVVSLVLVFSFFGMFKVLYARFVRKQP